MQILTLLKVFVDCRCKNMITRKKNERRETVDIKHAQLWKKLFPLPLQKSRREMG